MYLRDTPDYEAARRQAVWQARVPDRYPSAIVRARRPSDVVAAVRQARSAGRRVSVISSGHSYIASGLQDDRILISAAQLNGVHIDAEARTAWAEVGATNGELDALLGRCGLAFPVGHSPSVALGGYLLGGGLGWNSEAWGKAACFCVSGAEVVLADGQTVHTSRDAEPDLFWALRGAGPLFPGIVTRFSLELPPRPAATFRISRDYALDAGGDVAAWVEAVLPDKDLKVELSTTFRTLPGPLDKVVTVAAVGFADDEREAGRILDGLAGSLPDGGAVSGLRREPVSIPDLLRENDDPPSRYAVETSWTNETAPTLLVVAERFKSCPSPHSIVHVAFRTDPRITTEAAYTMSARNLVFCAGVWGSEGEDDGNIAWCDAVTDALGPLTVGRYINESDYLRHPHHVAAAFSPDAYHRILDLRRRYDPDGLFDSMAPLPEAPSPAVGSGRP